MQQTNLLGKISRLAALSAVTLIVASSQAFAQARVMNPGEAIGQLVYLSVDDVKTESPKYKGLSPLSIPVFAELPLELSVVAGAITLQQQNLLSHVQIKSRARHTPNLDISQLQGGMTNPLLSQYKDGAYVHMKLGENDRILVEVATETQAQDFYKKKAHEPLHLHGDIREERIFKTEDLTWHDFDKVGSKAANYAELGKAVNTAGRSIVRPGFAIPFHYYLEFLNQNPEIKTAIESMLRDPLMNKIAKVAYRDQKLKAVRDMIVSDQSVIDPKLTEELVHRFDQLVGSKGEKLGLKLRSSTNSEDLPNFNGAGLYDSDSYKPVKDGKEKPFDKKVDSVKKALRTVWASVWNVRAYDERSFFGIPHDEVLVGVQVNPAYSHEAASGVVVTRNVSGSQTLKGPGVYFEIQRGETYSVTNPVAGVKPERVLVLFDVKNPLSQEAYQIKVLQRSNVADDNKTILDHDNANPVMSDAEMKDLVYQCLKAHEHFEPLLGRGQSDFSLDLEFKVDSEVTGTREVYLKQARPFIN